jgi:hypothetical protein
MKAALATCKGDISPPGVSNINESQRADRSRECSPSGPNLNLEASRTPGGYVNAVTFGRTLKCVRSLKVFNFPRAEVDKTSAPGVACAYSSMRPTIWRRNSASDKVGSVNPSYWPLRGNFLFFT